LRQYFRRLINQMSRSELSLRNANLQIGEMRNAIQENGVPRNWSALEREQALPDIRVGQRLIFFPDLLDQSFVADDFRQLQCLLLPREANAWGHGFLFFTHLPISFHGNESSSGSRTRALQSWPLSTLHTHA